MHSTRTWMVLALAITLTACSDGPLIVEGDAGREGDGGTKAPPSGPACETDADCDNDRVCDGEEACEEGFCAEGTPMQCDDGIACTIDECSELLKGCESRGPDLDGDGHPDDSCEDSDGTPFGDDCDDTDPLRFPGNIEICDAEGHDEDCNSESFGEKDSDDDGFLDALCCNGDTCGDDCDDLKPSVNPGATEACDLFDNDCDGDTDEGVSVDVYPDEDRDGHGAEGKAVKRCAGTVGFAKDSNDCDDTDPEVFEGQFEICDNKDNNCDDQIDEIEEDAPWFLDADEDTFGDSTSDPIFSCVRVPGRVLSNNDCNDTEAAVNPAANEECDGVDNDCNGSKDFQLGVNDFEDDDNDGLADTECGAGAPDCDDLNPNTGDGQDEICDKQDNDCDGKVDEQTAQTVWYLDKDGDGWGIDQGTALALCDPIPGRSSNLGDCNDRENSIHPGAAESCNGVDQDCDGDTDEATDHLCSLNNSIASCKNGGCAVIACLAGFGNCDSLTSNGCECSVEVVPGGACSTDFDCSDYNYCNGRERCVGGACYPGNPVNCDPGSEVLQGSYVILNSFDIAALAGITTITGDLTINGSGLTHLNGLEGLFTVGGNLTIEGNQTLQRLSGSALSNLVTVGGVLSIQNNRELTNLDLPSLVTAGAIFIADNPMLAKVTGMNALVTVDGPLNIGSSEPEEQEVPVLTEIDGFNSLISVGSLTIANNPILATLKGFAKLDEVGQDVYLQNNALTAIGFPSLRLVGYWLDLTGYLYDSYGEEYGDSLPDTFTESISLPSLEMVGGYCLIRDRSALTSLDLGKLKDVAGVFSIANNAELTSASLPELMNVGGFEVASNYKLTSVSAPKLEGVLTDKIGYSAPYGIADGDFTVAANAISGLLSFPELITVDGQLRMFNDYNYTSTGASTLSMPKLTNVGGSVEIREAANLAELDLSALADIGGELWLENMPGVTMANLSALGTVGGRLYLYNLDQLNDLLWLGTRDATVDMNSTLSLLGTSLTISDMACMGQPEIDDFVLDLMLQGVSISTINNNTVSCSEPVIQVLQGPPADK